MKNKMTLGNVEVNVVQEDFGQDMGLLDWLFPSKDKKFSREQNISAGKAWITSVYNELKPAATYSTYIEALMLDGYGQKISEEDFQDFLDTVGYNVNILPSAGDKVKTSLLKAFSSNKNMLPNRRDIVSAFLNPDNVKWTYWDAIKVTASQAASTAVDVARGTASVISSGAGLIGFIVKYRNPIILISLAGVGFFLYKNREVVGRKLTEKGLKKLGLD